MLFFSGAAVGRSLGFGVDVLGRYGVRLLAVDRPGPGASGPAPGRTLDDWVRDVARLTAALRLTDVGIVGFSQGAPFALACAAARLAGAVAVVSGTDELSHPAFAGRRPPDVAARVREVAADPAGVEASFARSAGPELLWNLVLGTSSAVDRRVFADPAFAAAYKRALNEGFSQGAAGYARDFVLATSRWPFDPATIRVPVHLWYGGHDASPVHSPDRGAALARRLPTARRHLLPAAGGSVLWTHAGEILAALRVAGRP